MIRSSVTKATCFAYQNPNRLKSSFASTGRRWASVWVLSDPLKQNASGATEIPPSTLSAVQAAQQMKSGDIGLVTFGTTSFSPSSVPQGVSKVQHIHAESPHHLVPEALTQSMLEVVKSSSHIVGTSTKFGATLVPLLAGLLDVSPVTDITKVIDSNTFVRPLYAGNVLATVQAEAAASPLVLSIRPTSFDPVELQDTSSVTVEEIPLQVYEHSEWIKDDSGDSSGISSRPELTSAPIVISGGRGMGSGENFALLEKLADKLGTSTVALGASRAAVDAGMVPNDWQVGQTGKVVAPNLYVAVGISGAIQHISGMKDSKTIVAINQDPEAPIFQVADYGLVADLFQAIPELTEKV